MKRLLVLAAIITLAASLVACGQGSSPKGGVTIEALTSTASAKVSPTPTLVSAVATPVATVNEITDPDGYCHTPQYFGEGTIYWESSDVCIVRGDSSHLLQARIQATTLGDFNARKAFAETKLTELVKDGTLTSSEVCSANARTGLFTEQADLGGAGSLQLTLEAAEAIGCTK